MRLKSLVTKLCELEEYSDQHQRDPQVVLIVNGVAYPIDQIWWEPHQRGFDEVRDVDDLGAVCIGDDSR